MQTPAGGTGGVLFALLVLSGSGGASLLKDKGLEGTWGGGPGSRAEGGPGSLAIRAGGVGAAREAGEGTALATLRLELPAARAGGAALEERKFRDDPSALDADILDG